MKMDELKKLTLFEQAVIMLLESIDKRLEKIENVE